MKTKEVAEICGVSIPTITENAKKVGIVLENGKAHEWTEEELEKVQKQLLMNQTSQGNPSIVKDEALKRFNAGMSLMEIVRSGNVEAMKELMNLSMAAVQETARVKELEEKNRQLEQKNLLLIEQKEAAEAEIERIFKYNENFHNHLYTATDLAKMLGTNPNKIGRIATKFHLKQEPIYGKLGKMQVKNGRWVDIFYYNEDAKLVIENNL